jgi:MFS family permease
MNSLPTQKVTWRTHLSLLLLALVYIFSFIDRQVIAVLIEPIKRDFGASDTEMGLLSGLAFGLLYAAMGVPVGRLADRFNRRNIVAICCGLWSLATLACGLVGQFWQLLLARMSVAVGEAGGMAPSISMVSDMYPRERRSLAISLFMMGPHFGVLIGLALGGWIAHQYGWRSAFIAFGAPGMVLALMVRWFAQEPARGTFERANQVTDNDITTEPLRHQVLRLLRMPAFRRLALACGLGGLAGYGYGVWIPSFLMRSHGLTLAQAGLMFGVASGGGAVLGSVCCGWLGDRLTRRDAGWQLGLPMLGMLMALPCALAFILWTGGTWTLGSLKVPHAMAFAVLFAFFASWWAPLSYSAVSQMVHASERSVAAALLNFFITLFGSGLGPLVTGMLSDLLLPRLGDDALRWALVAIMLLMLPAGLFLGSAVASYRQRLQALNANAMA